MTSGPIGLHGGGEFQPGDEPFLRALLNCARAVAGSAPARIAIVPTAAAVDRPEAAVAFGSRAFEAVAADSGVSIEVDGSFVVDAASASDAALASRLEAANCIYLPGGDPGRIASILRGSLAWAAILRAHAGGAVIAGASAGAMVLAPWTWTRDGGALGLGLVPGIVVVPHAERVARTGWRGTFAERARLVAATAARVSAAAAREPATAGSAAGASAATGSAASNGSAGASAATGSAASNGSAAASAATGSAASNGSAAAGALVPVGLEERTGILSDPRTGAWRVFGEGRVHLGGRDRPARTCVAGDVIADLAAAVPRAASAAPPEAPLATPPRAKPAARHPKS